MEIETNQMVGTECQEIQFNCTGEGQFGCYFPNCPKALCLNCAKPCTGCREQVCYDHSAECTSCNELFCDSCNGQCNQCQKWYCTSCLGKHRC